MLSIRLCLAITTLRPQLAAQLAKIERELRRKERKLEKYNRVLKAKKHVRDTLRQHNVSSENQGEGRECMLNVALLECLFRSDVSFAFICLILYLIVYVTCFTDLWCFRCECN